MVLKHPPYQSVLASEARTATTTSPMFANHDASGALLIVAISAITATPAITPKVQVSADGQGGWADYAVVTTALATAATSTYLLYPGILASSDGAVTESWNLPLPRYWRVVMTHGDADSATYTVTVQYL